MPDRLGTPNVGVLTGPTSRSAKTSTNSEPWAPVSRTCARLTTRCCLGEAHMLFKPTTALGALLLLPALCPNTLPGHRSKYRELAGKPCKTSTNMKIRPCTGTKRTRRLRTMPVLGLPTWVCNRWLDPRWPGRGSGVRDFDRAWAIKARSSTRDVCLPDPVLGPPQGMDPPDSCRRPRLHPPRLCERTRIISGFCCMGSMCF